MTDQDLASFFRPTSATSHRVKSRKSSEERKSGKLWPCPHWALTRVTFENPSPWQSSERSASDICFLGQTGQEELMTAFLRVVSTSIRRMQYLSRLSDPCTSAVAEYRVLTVWTETWGNSSVPQWAVHGLGIHMESEMSVVLAAIYCPTPRHITKLE